MTRHACLGQESGEALPKIRLSLACTQTDRSAAILDGRIQVAGCEIVGLPGQTQDIFRRVLNDQAFDVAEMSMSSHIVQTGRMAEAYVAIPVYLSRVFRHSAIYVRTDRRIERAADLAGKTIGIEQYQQTVGLWVRGILGDEYGVRTQDVNWINGGLEQPGGGERVALTLPDGIRLSSAPADATLNGMLADGRLDALIGSRPPSCYEKGHPQVARLFPDHRKAETEYFGRTRIFPIMHCVVIRRSLVERHPWLAVEVFRAFAAAKAAALKDLFLMNIARVSLAWISEDAEATRRVLGDNMWSYGLKASRHEIEAMIRYARNDGLITRDLTPEDVFHPSTHGLADSA
jgi:4,5-dihydroxyphthalate decarboxylase